MPNPATNPVLDRIKQVGDGISALREDFNAKTGELKELYAELDTRTQNLMEKFTIAPGARQTVSVPGVEGHKFSFARAISAIAAKDWTGAEYERDVFAETQKRAGPLGAGSGTGSHFVPEEVMGDVIPLIRSKMILDDLGLTRLELQGSGYNVDVPKHSADATTYWVGDNSTITEDTTFDTSNVTLTPKTLACLLPYSRTMLRTGTVVNVEAFIRDALAKAMALEIQAKLWNGGSTSLEPTGVLDLSGNTDVTFTNTTDATVFDGLQQMVEELEVANGLLDGSVAWVMHPRAKHRIAKIRYSDGYTTSGATGPTNSSIISSVPGDSTAAYKGELLGYRLFQASNVPIDTTASPKDQSDLWLAPWSEVLWGLWGDLELQATDVGGNAFLKNQILVRALMQTDFKYQHANLFVQGNNINHNVNG